MPSIIPDNRAKHALAENRLVVGLMLAEIRQPSFMQLLANAGFDFVIIDNEHGAFPIDAIADLSRMARILGVTPLVRVPDLAYPYLAQSLDAGAQGVMVPRITDVAQVREALSIIKYPPMGRRGCAFNRGHSDFRGGPLVESMAKANDETWLVIQIETREALENVEAIAAVPGVDALFIGPTDLSIALGVPGESTSPVLLEAVERVMAASAAHGLATAIQANDMAYAQRWAARGMKMISYGSETGIFVAAASAAIQNLRSVPVAA